MAHDHPESSESDWDNPDFCPFCGAELIDAGAGFMEHIEDAETCRERFEDWRTNIVEDVGEEWGG
ncbi:MULTISPECIES: DUF7501 family protein [Salinibaculum]|uniref:DUF7501 family protein n=1 Tax=Salinibaculum TaxID=2732368 RepID=UPI0030D2B27A